MDVYIVINGRKIRRREIRGSFYRGRRKSFYSVMRTE